MPRLRQKGTGVVASVDEATASSLGPDWELVDDAPVVSTTPRRPRRKPASDQK